MSLATNFVIPILWQSNVIKRVATKFQVIWQNSVVVEITRFRMSVILSI